MKPKQEDPKEMVGGCCVCSDENGWAENPLVYCDGQGCNVAVHQACYGIVTVPTGAWFCRKCESQERAARVRCELCPSKDGALKRTDSGGWAHVVCALYIPEVRFGNVTTMEPIMLQLVPQERFNKSCYLCDEAQRVGKATIGACMQCNRTGCKNHFHVTCAQAMGLLCEEAGNYMDNVKYCGYCQYHYNKLLPNLQRRGSHVKTIPPYRPVAHDTASSDEEKASGSSTTESKEMKIKKRSASNKSSPVHDASKHITREVKVNLGGDFPLGAPLKSSINSGGESSSRPIDPSVNLDFSVNVVQSSAVNVRSESKFGSEKLQLPNSSGVPNATTITTTTTSVTTSNKHTSNSVVNSISDSKTSSSTFPSSNSTHTTVTTITSSPLSSATSTIIPTASVESLVTLIETGGGASGVTMTHSSSMVPSFTIANNDTSAVVSTPVSLSAKLKMTNVSTSSSPSPSSGHSSLTAGSQPIPAISVSLACSSNISEKEKQQIQRKARRNGSNSNSRSPATVANNDDGNDDFKEAGALVICEERNLSSEPEKPSYGKFHSSLNEDSNVSKYGSTISSHFSSLSSGHSHKLDSQTTSSSDAVIGEPLKRGRSNSQDKNRRSKRGASNAVASSTTSKRGRIPVSSREKDGTQDSGASSPESLASSDLVPAKRSRNSKPEVKDSKDSLNSVITNGVGVGASTILLGNQINPASAVAQKMADTLQSELEAHSIYRDEEKLNVSLIGPALPGKRETSTPGVVLNSSQPPPLPQSLEQLLERQWEQGSQFLMEQAQHFDIASLLSCLHQLRQENVRLEETVNNLISRRDHLLAVNARLSVPLASNQGTTQASLSSSSSSISASTASLPSTLATPLPSSTSSSSSSLISITPVTPSIATSLVGGGQLQISSHVGSVSSSAILASRGSHSQQQQQRHPSGGNSHSGIGNPPSRVSGERGPSPHDRRNHHQGQPVENGLPESEYRYRSPGSEHHPRQQSPMLPPGAQPSPTSMRQSPATSSYHSGSPHSGVPSLSPSGVSHPAPPQHTLVTHVPSSHSHSHGSHHSSAHHPSSSTPSSGSHGASGSHVVSLSRSTVDHPRGAELVRLTSAQPHTNPSVGYPIYPMVSPTVPGPHHSPVGMQQHQQHATHSQQHATHSQQHATHSQQQHATHSQQQHATHSQQQHATHSQQQHATHSQQQHPTHSQVIRREIVESGRNSLEKR